ncbi:hypothetical protein JA1_002321 [Spathaspora sp. JA1]|nr:hypothetical protein JA1_002321 [Spathaspora sp. JA1]
MITRIIPQLDSELQVQFSHIIKNKTFNQVKSEASWEKDILPKLLARLDQLVTLSQSQQEKQQPEATDLDFVKSIESNSERIKNHLVGNFTKSPPFTITRIAEVINDPIKEGYAIDDNIKLVKYFNSLKKLVLVSSTIDDFPQVDFSDPDETDEKSEPVIKVVGQSASTIPLIEIPWLSSNEEDGEGDSKQKSEEEVKEDIGGAESRSETTDEIDNDEQSSKKRRNVEDKEAEQESKKSKAKIPEEEQEITEKDKKKSKE